jgi:ribosomal protein L7/L12
MRGDKTESAIEAANLIIDNLHTRHRLSLVTFSTSTRVLLDNEAPTEPARPKLRQQVEALRSGIGGKTRLTLGIRRAMQTFKAQTRERFANTMIILSDGGADKPADAFQAARQAADAGVQIFAVGVGDAYRADQLLKLVKPAAGAVLDYRESHGLNAAFQAILGRIESFVATNARLTLRLDKGVRPGPAYRTSPENASLGKPSAPKGEVAFNLGHLEPDKRYGLLIDLKARKREPNRLATALFTCDIPSLGIRGWAREIDVYADPDAAASRADWARRSAEVADAADALARATRVSEQREALERLAAAGAEANSETLRARAKELLRKLDKQGAIDNASLNAVLVVASHTADAGGDDDGAQSRKPGVKLYDVVLVDAGDTPIRVMREIREATGQSLAEIDRALRGDEKVISKAVLHRDARDLQKRVKAAGAKVAIERCAHESRGT